MKTVRDQDFRNIVGDTYLAAFDKNKVSNPRFHQCCGFAATGDEAQVIDETAKSEEPVKVKVQNVKALGYAKTILALIGLYVVIKFIYGKIKK